jgi:hypothetical protein
VPRLNLPMLNNFLGFFLVEHCKLTAGMILDSQEFIQFGVNSLRITVLGSLDEKSHDPGRERRHGLPIKRVGRNYQPQDNIKQDDEKRIWMRSPYAELRDDVASGKGQQRPR